MEKNLTIRIILPILLIIQLWFLFVTFTHPKMEIIVQRDDKQLWTVVEINESYVNPGVRVGDVIHSVNGIPADQYPSIVKWRSVDQASTMVIERNGAEYTLSSHDLSRFTGMDALSLTGGVMSIFISFLLFKKMNLSRSALYLSLVLLVIGLTFISLSASIRGDTTGKVCTVTFIMLLPVVFLHFLIEFLNEKGNLEIRMKALKYLYALVGINFVAALLYYVPVDATYYVYSITRITALAFFVICLCMNIVFLSVMWFKYRKGKTHLSIILESVWAALFLSFTPIICFSFIPEIIYGLQWVDSYITSWFILFLPLTFAYLIGAKRLYDIDMFLRRILLAAAISIIPSGLFIGIIWMFLLSEAKIERLTFVFLLFEILFTFILYSLEYFTTKLEPVMFPRKYKLQASLHKISKRLGSITSFRELKDIILVDLVNTLQVFGGAIAFKYKDSIEIIHQGDISVAKVELLIATGDLDHEQYLCFEINRQEEYTSYLIMTQKRTMTLLGTEERQWLNLIITYLAVSLENVHLIRKLTMRLQQLASHMPDEQVAGDFNWFRKLMFELQEKERVRIATELHDTTMQDLFFLKERFQTLLEKYMLSEDDKALMMNMVEYIDVINSNLRQSCFELHPYLLKEVGLVQTIEKLVDFEMAVCSFDLEFEAKHAYRIEQWDIDRKQHIFRMIQELINNAKKHSQATRVRITLDAAQQMLYLSYEDNGIGFDPNFTAAKEIGSSGIGMEQMKSRIFSLNGHFELSTSKGNGVKFFVTIPMKEGTIT